MAVQSIVVIGASYAGLATAHYFLKHTIPSLEKTNNTKYKLTLISATTHFFHKVGAPRALASSDLLPISKIFIAIEDGFKTYDPEHFQLVIGEAKSIDEANKTISVSPTYDSPTTNTPKSIPYSTLILATGASSESPLWSIPGSHEKTIAALKATQSALSTAKTVLIAGGGPAGVETAGEIASLFPNINTTLLSGNDRLLTRLRPAIAATAESKLASMGVTTIHGLKALSATPAAEAQTTTTQVKLSDGSTRTVDLYILATGIRPNTAFLPRHWLTETGYVITADKLSLRGPVDHVYAIGDVAGYSLGGVFDIMDAVRPLASTVAADLGVPGAKAVGFKQTVTETQLVPIGPGGGVGALFGWRVPSFVVWMIKSRDYMVGSVVGTVMGEKYVKA
ncbi:MAG: hypothetical protein LQ352_008287 [Teloschistes flavicans]|nr:MAG: hypothetical protein LQ352_008287 [Teloschistes flavicans]